MPAIIPLTQSEARFLCAASICAARWKEAHRRGRLSAQPHTGRDESGGSYSLYPLPHVGQTQTQYDVTTSTIVVDSEICASISSSPEELVLRCAVVIGPTHMTVL